ncbi:FAD-dependent monooxygenase [Streptomyces sp. NPDC057910]|uniref:FAD-dependent monooxygenase n=1 Tax=Streptomyces sp. NPDC057910 TaxID=3346278 RepID=UPI0036E8E2FD
MFERDSPDQAALRTGHGLILMQNGVTALRALGADGFLRRHRALEHAIFQDHRGLNVRAEPLHGAYCVTRLGLIEALKGELPPETVEYGRRCVRVELTPSLPPGRDPRSIRRRVQTLEFEAGPPLSRADADLFIGAEGWRSAMYAAYNPAEVRDYSAVFEIVSSTHLPELATQLGSTFVKTLFADRGLAFGLLSPTPERVVGFLQFDAGRHGSPAATSGPELAAFVTELIGDAPEPVASYLRLADYATAHLWRPPDADVAGGLCGDNAVIVGDAAHPLLPFTSQGAGAALEDAVILADSIALIGDRLDMVPRVLAGFCDDRRRGLAAFVTGGRQLLSHFLGASGGFVAPYLEGTVSKLADHLSLPPTDLASLWHVFDPDNDGYATRDGFSRALGLIIDETVEAADGDAVFAECDTNEDGRVELEELLTALGGGGDASPALWRIRRLLTPRRIAQAALAHRVSTAFGTIDDDAGSRPRSGVKGSTRGSVGLMLRGLGE